MGLADDFHDLADAVDRATAASNRHGATKARDLEDSVRRGQADQLLDTLAEAMKIRLGLK